MKANYVVLFIILISISAYLPASFAEPSIHIIMKQSIFGYGEKLSYTIEVSEITGEIAILHIRDSNGKGSSAIPIEISELKTDITSPFPFEKEIFPVGNYYIDIEYSGAKDSKEFTVIDSGKTVLPFWMRQIAYSWINNDISDGALIDAIQKSTNDELLTSAQIDKNHLELIYIPIWVKTTAGWWLEDKISDDNFVKLIQYLINVKTIKI